MSDLVPWMAPWSGRLLTVVVVLLGLAVVRWASLRRRRHSDGAPHCPKCDYNLTGLPAPFTCPECGHRAASPSTPRLSPRRWRLASIGVLIALALPIYVAQRRVRQFGWDYYLSLYPLYALTPERKVRDVTIDGIRFRQYEDRRLPGWPGLSYTRLLVEHNGQVLLNESASAYWEIGSDDPPHFGLIDLNHDGTQQLILHSNECGTGSDNIYRVMNFDCRGGTMRYLGITRLEGFLTLNLRRDHEPTEISFGSKHYRSRWTGGSDSPYPTMFLKFRNGVFELDKEHTRRPLPDESELKRTLDELKTFTHPPSGPSGYAIGFALDMIYAGHLKEARAVLDAIDCAFPDDPPLSEQILAEVRKAPFGKDVLALSDDRGVAAASPK